MTNLPVFQLKKAVTEIQKIEKNVDEVVMLNEVYISFNINFKLFVTFQDLSPTTV